MRCTSHFLTGMDNQTRSGYTLLRSPVGADVGCRCFSRLPICRQKTNTSACTISCASIAEQRIRLTRLSIIVKNAVTCLRSIPLDEINVTRETWNKRPLSVWRYREVLPVTITPVTLQEGGNPLYHLKRLGDEMGLKHLYAKHEGMNPSGSFKDRGMTVGVSMAIQPGEKERCLRKHRQYVSEPRGLCGKSGDSCCCFVTCRKSCGRKSSTGADAWRKSHLHPGKFRPGS